MTILTDNLGVSFITRNPIGHIRHMSPLIYTLYVKERRATGKAHFGNSTVGIHSYQDTTMHQDCLENYGASWSESFLRLEKEVMEKEF